MDNMGKAIYMAASVFLFIIAATTSIYLYGTLNSYLNVSTNTISTDKRAEMTDIDGSKKTRIVSRSEIYITLFNMEQMHVNKLIVKMNDMGDYTVSLDESGEMQGNYDTLIRLLNNR